MAHPVYKKISKEHYLLKLIESYSFMDTYALCPMTEN